MTETKAPAGARLMLDDERIEARRTDRGGILEVYPDVHLAEEPAGGIWRTSRVPTSRIVKLSPLTVAWLRDEDAPKADDGGDAPRVSG